MEKNNKGLIIVLILIIIALSILCFLLATGKVSFISNEDTISNTNETVDEVEKDNNTDMFETIKLEKETETFSFDKLILTFNGKSSEYGEDFYNYILNIKYDGKDIDSSFFNDEDNYRIYSNNMAADFKVYRINDVYVLISFIARQCLCNEVMIFNTNGEILETFERVDIEVDNNKINITTSDNGQCMGEDYEEHLKELVYTVESDKLLEE